MFVGDLLRDSALRAPDRVALIGRGQRLTYAQFAAASNCLANALLELGLNNGAKVAILSRNCPQYAIAYFAIARTPYVSAHCSTRSSADELAYVLNKLEAEVLFLESRFSSVIHDVLAKLERPIRLIFFDRPGGTERELPGAVSLEQCVTGMSADAPSVVLEDSDPLAITLTGGTTGFPKGVLVSHKARCASAVAAAADFGLDETDVVAASTPLFHTAGLFVWFATAVMQGASVVLPESWDPIEFMRQVEKEKITAAFLVPSQLNDLVTHTGFSNEALKTLRNIGYAGAPMGRALSERIRAALPDVMFTENYGQSEACPITIRCEKHGADKRETVGRAAGNAEVGIMNEEGHLLPPGEIGDIVTRGDQVFDEYFNDPEETTDVFRLGDGWLLTGDVGFLDDDGFLSLVDRSKDMLVSGGENVYPAEIENALYQHKAVVECAVFGIPDERWGEVPAAHLVLAPGAAVSEEELIDFCATKIARFKRPRVVKFVSELPKTAVGKIHKNELREPYWVGYEKKI
ncbi:MAG: long-chain fatty acid--CoA ligase [Gammaproteobacteria bacterium]|nr:MAG: long-chain fatty acid--CoA ligase [Gammaproteobacteria bacterium]